MQSPGTFCEVLDLPRSATFVHGELRDRLGHRSWMWETLMFSAGKAYTARNYLLLEDASRELAKASGA